MDRLAYLRALGITPWHLRASQPVSADPPVEPAEPAEIVDSMAYQPVQTSDLQSIDLTALRHHVSQCQACELHQTRKHTVFGEGHHKVDWLIIGEAPGADEDREGQPFVGPAGQLLTQMLRAIGLAREEVFITNILKCRPPNNRDPKVAEIHACHAYLVRQIQLLEPKIIICLGRVAAQALLQSELAIGKMRGQIYHLGRQQNIPTVVTYHPAYLLRSPREKRKVWEDLKLARAHLLSLA